MPNSLLLSCLASLFLVTGCATNRLHLTGYTEARELERLRLSPPAVSVNLVTGGENCGPCSEGSKIVWHAANMEGRLYEGFGPIPIKDWSQFVSTSLGSTGPSHNGINVNIERVFLKTWQNPPYYAVEVHLAVERANTKHNGTSSIKIAGAGQTLLSNELVGLNQAVFEALQLGIAAAYWDATKSTQPPYGKSN